MKPQNIKEAKALVIKYRSITLNDIKKLKYDHNMMYVSELLTGFGSHGSCTLCVVIGGNESRTQNCKYCIYGMSNGCLKKNNIKTFDAIVNAITPTTLRNAFRKRADHIELILESYEN